MVKMGYDPRYFDLDKPSLSDSSGETGLISLIKNLFSGGDEEKVTEPTSKKKSKKKAKKKASDFNPLMPGTPPEVPELPSDVPNGSLFGSAGMKASGILPGEVGGMPTGGIPGMDDVSGGVIAEMMKSLGMGPKGEKTGLQKVLSTIGNIGNKMSSANTGYWAAAPGQAGKGAREMLALEEEKKQGKRKALLDLLKLTGKDLDPTNQMQNYEYALKGGYQGSFMDFLKDTKGGMISLGAFQPFLSMPSALTELARQRAAYEKKGFFDKMFSKAPPEASFEEAYKLMQQYGGKYSKEPLSGGKSSGKSGNTKTDADGNVYKKVKGGWKLVKENK